MKPMKERTMSTSESDGALVVVDALPVKLQAARTVITYRLPFLADTLWRMRFSPKAIRTFSVDMWGRALYDPEVVEACPVDEIVGAVYHEVTHLLRDHPRRGASLIKSIQELFPNVDTRYLVNIGMDLEIHQKEFLDLFKMPNMIDIATPDKIGFPQGKMMEEYIEMLLALPQKKISCGGKDKDQPAVGQGRCGSCATGEQEAWEDGPPTESEDGIQPEDLDLLRQQAAEHIARMKGAGTVPSDWVRWAETLLNPQVPWQRVLPSAIRSAVAVAAGAQDYSYRRMSRRTNKIILPSLRRKIPKVCVVLDTSGSMRTEDLSAILAETYGILMATGSSVIVFATDAEVHTKQTVLRAQEIRLVGGGGTDMGKGIAAAEKEKPDVIIVLTDGYTPWPARAPKAGVIVCLVGEAEITSVPSWARVVQVRK